MVSSLIFATRTIFTFWALVLQLFTCLDGEYTRFAQVCRHLLTSWWSHKEIPRSGRGQIDPSLVVVILKTRYTVILEYQLVWGKSICWDVMWFIYVSRTRDLYYLWKEKSNSDGQQFVQYKKQKKNKNKIKN